MAKELKDYSDYELYKELSSRDNVEVVMWLDEDIADALVEEDVKPTKANIQTAWDKIGKWLRESSIEHGWDVIFDAINDCDFID